MSTTNNGTDAAKQASPSPRPSNRHQIKRSLTDFASPSRLHFRPRRQNSEHEDRERVKPPVSSAAMAAHLPRSLDVPVPSGGNSLPSSTDESQRAGILGANENGHEEARQKREAGLLLEQEWAALRADGLKQSIAEMNSFSTTVTKQLDDAYCQILERTSDIQNIVASLQDMARSCRALRETYDSEARALESDLIHQLSAAGHFEEKQRRIAALEKCIQEVRDKAAALASRVGDVQASVERWEEADRQWQEKTRKRLKIIWSATTVLALILIAFVIGMKYASREGGGQGGGLKSADSRATMSPHVSAELSISRRNETVEQESVKTLLQKTPLGEAEELRAFDEL